MVMKLYDSLTTLDHCTIHGSNMVLYSEAARLMKNPKSRPVRNQAQLSRGRANISSITELTSGLSVDKTNS